MGLKNGIMDVISTDHAPHSEEEKNRSIEKASFGIVGLETSAALTYTELVKTGVLSIMDMAEKMSYNPAQILGLTEKGAVAEGKQHRYMGVTCCTKRNEYRNEWKRRIKRIFISKCLCRTV